MLTNVVLVIPTLAILIIVAAYVTCTAATEAIPIELTSWPWAARAVRGADVLAEDATSSTSRG